MQAQVDAGGFNLGYAVATYQVGPLGPLSNCPVIQEGWPRPSCGFVGQIHRSVNGYT